MPPQPILQPVVVLAGWTLVMLVWTIATRLPAMRAAKIDMGELVGTNGASADRALPREAQWKAHNYNHLLEQPTLFYAICLVIALTGTGVTINLVLAWSYVGLRVAHSLVQATVNRVRPRFVLFMLSTVALAALILHAAMAVF